jgi:PAS domain S-box-containing protein
MKDKNKILEAENTQLRKDIIELKENLSLYSSIIEDQTVLIIRYRPDGTRTFVNENYCKYVGIPRSKLIGSNLFDFIEDNERDRIKKKISLLSAENPVATDEHKVILPTGTVRWNQWTDRALLDENDQVIEIQATGQDITERKLAENALKVSGEKHRIMSEKISDSNNLKDLLLDVITHDLKNPAGVIKGMTELMMDDFEDNEMVNIIHDSSEDLLSVIENAVTLSNVAQGEEIKKQNLDLVEVIKTSIKSFSASLKKTKMKITDTLPEKLMVHANPIISMVFSNYISNAIRYASKGKKIIVDYTDNPESVTIRVKDFGKMIHPQDYERVFERRIQLAPGANKGRGLGLAIVKRIAIAHNGKVWIEPNDSKGNSFCFEVPKARQTDKDEAIKAIRESITYPDRPIILVVEDNPANMEYLLFLLNKFQLNSITATSGEEAVEIMKGNYVDCMLLDINLGKGISGIVLMEMFRNQKEFEYIPIAAVTAYFGGGLSRNLLDKGFSDFLAKPFTKDQLKSMLQRYVSVTD